MVEKSQSGEKGAQQEVKVEEAKILDNGFEVIDTKQTLWEIEVILMGGNKYRTKGMDPNKNTVGELREEIENLTGIPK